MTKNKNTYMKTRLITLLLAASAILFITMPAQADHTNTHTNVVITCDFTVLEDAMDDLVLSDIKAPNNNARRGRLNSLENALENALEAAEDGDVEGVRDALKHIAKKADGRKNAWIIGAAADVINDAIDDLLECLEAYDDDDDDEE